MEILCIKSKFLKNLFDHNTYVVKNGDEALIIDAGAELDDVKEVLAGAKVLAILITHLHFDHFWNLEDYLAEFKCNVYIKEGFDYKFEDSSTNGAYVIKMDKRCKIDKNVVKYYENSLKIGNFDAHIYSMPGHCADLVAVKIGNNLFSGDLIFDCGIGRTDLPDSDDEKMQNSLNTLKNIDFDTLYPGHYSFLNKEVVNLIIEKHFNY